MTAVGTTVNMPIPEVVAKEIDAFGIWVERLKHNEIPEEKFKRFRLQNGIYGQRQADTQMVRVKIPSGLLNAEKLRCLADIAEHYSTGKGHVTTRQDMQFHFVRLEDGAAVMRRLAESGLTTREACGNTVRNVTACHLAGVCPTELFDVTEISEKVAFHLLRNPINQDLPRKFKISFSGCQTECGLAAIHDIGFIAAIREREGATEYGFKVLVGGGLGSSPKLAKLYSEFLPLDEILPLCEAILKIFDAHGDRKTRSKARMKFVVEKWGIVTFKSRVAEEIAILKASGAHYPALQGCVKRKESPPLPLPMIPNSQMGGDASYEQWVHTNVVHQADAITCSVQVKLNLGDITSSQLRGLANICDQFSPHSEIRATHQQNFILHRIDREALPRLHVALGKIALAEAGAERVVDVIACPGSDSCQLALTSSMGVGTEIQNEFSQNLPDYGDLTGLRIRISGCPNSCGHHHIAGIGFHGVGKKINGRLVPHYQLHLGGGVSADRAVIGHSKLKLPAKNVPKAVMEMIRIFREKRKEGELFNTFVERYGREAIVAQLEPFTKMMSHHSVEAYYRDYKGESDFSLDDLGPGECAGTVIDLMENLLRTSRQAIDEARDQVAHQQSQAAPVAIETIRRAILRSARALLIPFGVDSINDGEILKEFQHKLVEQGLLSERFEQFTEDLGEWAKAPLLQKDLQAIFENAVLFVTECREAYDRLDANFKLRKREETISAVQKEDAMQTDKKIDVKLNLAGVMCPMNFVKTKLQLEEMETGQLLEVVIDDGTAVKNVPRSVKAEGHKVLNLTQLPDGHYKMLIEKV